jgi:hypothetical protein
MTFDRNHDEKCGKSARGYLEDRQTIHNVCVIFGLSYGTCQQILSDELNMWRIAAKFVPSLLSNDQRNTALLSAPS